jgi:hypothetical protein
MRLYQQERRARLKAEAEAAGLSTVRPLPKDHPLAKARARNIPSGECAGDYDSRMAVVVPTPQYRNYAMAIRPIAANAPGGSGGNRRLEAAR